MGWYANIVVCVCAGKPLYGMVDTSHTHAGCVMFLGCPKCGRLVSDDPKRAQGHSRDSDQ